LDFAVAHPTLVADWNQTSNTLVVLTAPDELALCWLCEVAGSHGVRFVTFNEPDLGGAMTAAAFEPNVQRLVSHFPLAFSE
jgi:hypothetical protein